MDRLDLRAADTDRDRAIALLREALAQGRINEGEFSQRASQALDAATYAQLRSTLADLPISPADLPQPPSTQSVDTGSADSAASPSASQVGGARTPTRRTPAQRRSTVPIEVQRRRSLIASMVALMTIFTGAAIIATTPVSDVYADPALGYDYGTAVERDEFGAAIISEKMMFDSGAEYGYEVLRHDGEAGILRITADYSGAVIRVRVDPDGDGPDMMRSSSHRGVADIYLPEGSVPVEISVEGAWSYAFEPIAAAPDEPAAP